VHLPRRLTAAAAALLAVVATAPTADAATGITVREPVLSVWKAHQAQLGVATFDVIPLRAGGSVQHFQRGDVYTSPAGTGAIYGAISDTYRGTHWENGPLGYPITSEITLRAGAFTPFQGGSIYWSPATGGQVVRGAIRDRWGTWGWENGPLGYPTTSEEALFGGGAFSTFQGGSIYWNPATGAQVVRGAIRDRWVQAGSWDHYVAKPGFPTTSEFPVRGGAGQHFERASIYWSPATGAHVVRGALRDTYADHGWETGVGFPVSEEFGPLRSGASDALLPGGAAAQDAVEGWGQHFSGGSLYWSGLGGYVVHGAIRDAYAAQGWERGAAGFPLSDEELLPGGGVVQEFEGGDAYWSPRTGVHFVLGGLAVSVADREGTAEDAGLPLAEAVVSGGTATQRFQMGTLRFTPAGEAPTFAYTETPICRRSGDDWEVVMPEHYRGGTYQLGYDSDRHWTGEELSIAVPYRTPVASWVGATTIAVPAGTYPVALFTPDDALLPGYQGLPTPALEVPVASCSG
jgi:uncharacterized protein with LGFP repeats